MYDIIGNVNDSQDLPLQGVIVSDGTKSVTTNEDGYYELKTDKKSLTFSKGGFITSSFDLSKYKSPASVNVDITLKQVAENTKKNNKKLTKTLIYVGVGAVILVGGFFLYKKFKK
jgi:hypothetical protein